MITDKEYPATHSMDTAWFAIDTDGNVGILDFNDNGPVPDGIPQTASEHVLAQTMADRGNRIGMIRWSDHQIDDFIKKLRDYDGTMTFYSAFVQIDTAQTDYFQTLFTSIPNPESKCCDLVCLSQEKGVYYAEFYEFDEKQINQIKERKIIRKYFDAYFDNDVSWYDERQELVFKHEFAHVPVYLYQQPFQTDRLMQKTYIPQYPLKGNQLSERVKEKAIRLPFRFDEKKSFQIAEYLPFCVTHTETKNNGEHYLLPTDKGETAYIRTNSLPFVWCGRTCNKCAFDLSYTNFDIHDFSVYQYCEQPTLAIIYGVHSSMEHTWMEHWPVLRHAVALPVIYGYPVPFEVLDFETGKYIRKQGYKHVFENCKGHLEEALQTVKPYALILFKETKNKLAQYYHIEGDRITIDGVEYPFFMYNRMAEVYDEVKSYAEMPYRGKIVNRVKDMEERQSEE